VALRAAVERPERIASLTLYEPSAFHLLKVMGAHGAHALAEILAISKRTADGVSCGDYRGAAASFVDYWGGQVHGKRCGPRCRPRSRAGRRRRRSTSARCSTNACPQARTRPACPGADHARPARARPDARDCRAAAHASASARLAIVEGAGHMGPLTHADNVNAIIVRHIAEAEAAA